MPTLDITERCWQDYKRLWREERRAFLHARDEFYAWLVAKKQQPNLAPPAHLRLHFIESKDAWSITFGGDLRALWRYGPEVISGDAHIIWYTIGGHDIY